MNKQIRFIALFLLILPFTALSADNGISSFFPEDAVVYLQSGNMLSLIESYQASDFGRKYLETAAFRDFGDSKLYLKLEERVGNWERLTGFKLHIDNIKEFAGGESAVAVYDIGELQVLFATKVTYPQASKSKLFKLKTSFETKKKDDIEYYVKQGGEGLETFAFGYVKNVLLIATDIQLFERSIDLLKGKSSRSLDSFPAFKQSAEKLKGDLVLFADMGKLVSDTYFRSYWIYRNITALKWMQYAAAQLSFEGCGAREERIYVPFTETALKMSSLNKDGLIKFLPSDTDYFCLTSAVNSEEIADAVMTNAWGLPQAATEEEARTDKQKRLYELRRKLIEFVKAMKPQERMDIVVSNAGNDPFGVEISSPVMLRTDKTGESEVKNMLNIVSAWFAAETSFKESYQYPIKTAAAGSWKFYYLDTPIYLSETFTIGINANAVVFMRSLKNMSKFENAGQVTGMSAGTVTYSEFSLSKTGDKFFKVFDSLKNAPGWTGTERKDLFGENIKSLFNLLNKINKITTMDRIDGNKLVRSVVYSCK